MASQVRPVNAMTPQELGTDTMSDILVDLIRLVNNVAELHFIAMQRAWNGGNHPLIVSDVVRFAWTAAFSS